MMMMIILVVTCRRSRLVLESRVDEGQEWQQNQEVEEEQDERNNNGSSKGDNDSRDSIGQYSNASESSQPAKRCKLPSHSKSTLKRICKRCHQDSNEMEEEQEEDDSNSRDRTNDNGDCIDGRGNDHKGPQPPKRRRTSPTSDSTSKCSRKVRFQLPYDGRLRTPSNLRCNHLQQFGKSPPHSPLGDDEPTPNTSAERHKWPISGFVKRITIGNKICYSMDFSLEQGQRQEPS